MTNTTWSVKPNHANTDAEFRSWGSAISTALAAIGLVQTSDTGQINWTTVTRASTNTDAGYEVWRFNDALQSTVPIFFKLYYGTGGSAAYPRIRFDVGSASNGSGTLSGTGSGNSIPTITPVVTSDTTARDCWAASDGSGFVMALWNNSSSASAKTIVAVDRMRDSTGAAVNKGWAWQYINQTVTKNAYVVNVVDAVGTVLTYTPCLVPFPVGAATTFLDASSNVMFFPHYMLSKQGMYAYKMILSYAIADLGYDAQVSVSHLGSSRTYRSLGSHCTSSDSIANVNLSAAIWWAT